MIISLAAIALITAYGLGITWNRKHSAAKGETTGTQKALSQKAPMLYNIKKNHPQAEEYRKLNQLATAYYVAVVCVIFLLIFHVKLYGL